MDQIGDVLTGVPNQQLLDDNTLKRHSTSGKYHPHRSPPDFVMATKHGLAKRVYVSKQEDTYAEEGRENCPCCGLPVEGELLPLCADLGRLYHLGSGYALYFKLLKYSLFLLFILFAASGLYNMISASVGGECAPANSNSTDPVTNATVNATQYCLQDYITTYTIANKRNSVNALRDQQILNLVAIVLMIVFFQFIRYELRKTAIVADDTTVTPSDYTVKLSGVPTDVKTREIVDWIQKFGTQENPVVVRKVCRSYDIVEFTELTRERDALADQKDRETVPELIATIDAQIQGVKDRIEILKQKNLTYARVVFVTFERASHAAFIENRFDKSLMGQGVDFVIHNLMDSPEKLHGVRIKVKRAPEPSNVLWENLGFSKRDKIKRKHKTTLITAASIIIGFAIILGISVGQSHLVGDGSSESYLIRALSIVASVLISCFNYILGQIMKKLAEYEKHGTYTGYFTGIARKLSVAQFINTAITPLIAKSIITTAVVIGIVSEETINFYGKGGLLEAIFFVFVSNAFLTPVMNIFDPFYFLKLFQRWRALNNPDDKTLDQKEAHALFEGMPVDMSYKYALLIKTMYLTAFYAPAIPVGILFAIAAMFLVYWSDKYVLLRRAALPFSLGDELSRSAVEYLEWMAVTFALGNVAFIYSLKDGNNELAFDSSSFVLSWFILGVSILHALLPMGAINSKLFPLIDEVTENASYDKARLEFYTDYDIENPITHDRALGEFRKAIAEGTSDHRLHTGKTFDDFNVDLQRLHSGHHGGHGHDHGDDDDFNQSGNVFQLLEGYVKTSHSNPHKAAHENKTQTLAVEAQIKGSSYDRSTSYKKVAQHVAFGRGDTANMA